MTTNHPDVAFPFGPIPAGDGEMYSTGMLLRDYFAAKAMQAAIAKDGIFNVAYVQIAAIAYEMADAMLEARK